MSTGIDTMTGLGGGAPTTDERDSAIAALQILVLELAVSVGEMTDGIDALLESGGSADARVIDVGFSGVLDRLKEIDVAMMSLLSAISSKSRRID